MFAHKARSEVLRAHNRRQHVKVATMSAGALAPALSASVKTQAALPQCCSAAFRDDSVV